MTPIQPSAQHPSTSPPTRFQGAFWLLGMALTIEMVGLLVVVSALVGLV
jgi:hypothetical protein